MRIYFDSKNEFHKYMLENRPKEIWLDNFSVDIPYIIIESYLVEDNRFIGAYNKQSLLGGKLDWMGWLFEFKNMYIKAKL